MVGPYVMGGLILSYLCARDARPRLALFWFAFAAGACLSGTLL